MPQITHREVQELFQAAVGHYQRKNGKDSNNWKADKELFELFTQDLWKSVDWPEEDRVAGLTLLNNYYFKAREKNKEDSVFKGNYDIFDLLSYYTFKKPFFIINSEVKNKFEKVETVKKRQEKIIQLNFGTLLEHFGRDNMNDFFDLPKYTNVWITNESHGTTGFYQDREAVDIVSRHLRTQMERGSEIADLSITRECSLPYSIQALINELNLNFRLRVLCYESDHDNIRELKKIGCRVFTLPETAATDLMKLDKGVILALTENTSGVYARDEEIFYANSKTYKRELFTNLLSQASDYIYLPFKNGDVYNTLLNVKKHYERKVEEEIIRCSSVIVEDNNEIVIADDRFIKLAKNIYKALKINYTDFSASPLACFLQDFVTRRAEITPDKKYTILNIGVTKSHPFELAGQKVPAEDEAGVLVDD